MNDVLWSYFVKRIDALVYNMQALGFDCGVESGYRTIEMQDQLYAIGRTAPGTIVTNAQGGHSWHNWGVACDIVFKDQDGNWNWNAPSQDWDLLISQAQELGLQPGGLWGGTLCDLDHFELHGDLTIPEALELGTPEKVWDVLARRLGVY